MHIRRTYSDEVSPEQLVEDLLVDRGIEDVNAFLKPKNPSAIPFSKHFPDTRVLKKTLALLKKAHENQDMIVVYSDYDADGITGGAILWETLHQLGFKVMPFIPSRAQGYGFSKEGIDNVIQSFNPKIIMSVDHGIVAHDEAQYIKSKDINLIITDHHQTQGKPPVADAVFHTTDLAGSGVAYFLARELASAMSKPLIEDHVGLAAIGTIADLVPLTNTNRAIAKYGIKQLRKTRRSGLLSLLQESKTSQEEISSYHIGFVIGPRINAFGRLEDPMDALRLLCTTDQARASMLASKAQHINSLRQDKVKRAVAEAEDMIDQANLIFTLQSETWEEGIIGLIAGRLTQKYHRPSIVMTQYGDSELAKASVRSIDGIHITNFLKDLKHHLEDMGGHAAAAGFSIKPENIEAFVSDVHEKAGQEIMDEDLVPKHSIDVQLPMASVTPDLIRELEKLEPFGMDNKRPVFASHGTFTEVKPIGKTGNHRALKVHNGMQAVYFSVPVDAKISKEKEYGIRFDMRMDTWNGRQYPKMYVKSLF